MSGARLEDALRAVESAVEAGHFDVAVAKLAEAAEWFVEWGFDIPLDRLEALLRLLERHDPDDPWVLYTLAWVFSTQRRHTLALVKLHRAERRFSARLPEGSKEARRAQFLCKMAAGVTYERDGRYLEARGAFEEALTAGDFHARHLPFTDEEERWVRHDPSGLLAFSLQALALYEEAGLTAAAARAHHNLGTRVLDRGEPLPARRFLERAYELKLGGISQGGLANTLNSLGHAERHLGLYERARAHLNTVLVIAEEFGHDTLLSYGLNNLAEVARDEGRFEEAQELYRRSIATKERMENVFGLAHSLASLADGFLFAHEPKEARQLAEQALTLRVPSPDPIEDARHVSTLARARLESGDDPALVAVDLDGAVDVLGSHDVKGELAIASWWRAVARQGMGDTVGAGEDARRALELVAVYRLEHLLAPHIALRPGGLKVIDSEDATLRFFHDRAREAGGQVDSPSVSARLFGDLGVFLAGREVEVGAWRSKKAVVLLAMLLHHRGDPIHREQAMEWLWPEADPERGGKNLNVALTALRRGLEAVHPAGSVVLKRHGQFYRIDPDSLSTDVQEFEQRRAQAIGAEERGAIEEALRLGGSALELATDVYLASEPYAVWAASERIHLAETVLDLQMRVAEWALTVGDPSQAIDHMRRALAADPLRERAWSLLIQAHLRQGDRGAAMRDYEQCARVLEEELGIAPSPELAALATKLGG